MLDKIPFSNQKSMPLNSCTLAPARYLLDIVDRVDVVAFVDGHPGSILSAEKGLVALGPQEGRPKTGRAAWPAHAGMPSNFVEP